MKVVIDTNVVVSAALKDRDPQRVILFVVENADFQWVASPEILTEYINVLGRQKFGLPPEILARWHAVFEASISVINVTEQVDLPRDPSDAKFLACALVAGAEYLVTGDKDFSTAHKIGNTTVLSVPQFKSLIIDVW